MNRMNFTHVLWKLINMFPLPWKYMGKESNLGIRRENLNFIANFSNLEIARFSSTKKHDFYKGLPVRKISISRLTLYNAPLQIKLPDYLI